MPKLILASQSPRRRELLERAGLRFEVVTCETEEVNDAALPPEEICARNSAAKAEAVARLRPDAVVIGADTLVFIDGRALGKPADAEEAFAMLRLLQGRTHSVCTAVAVIMPGGERRDFCEVSRVTFRRLDDEAIKHYLSVVQVLDKAGAYAIQEHGELIIERLDGDLDNVIGLPVTHLLNVLAL